MSIFTTDDKALHAAAVRAGIRTAAQSARGAGAAIVVSIGVSIIGVDWIVVGATAVASVINVSWAGIDAYLGMISSGVPKEYQDVQFVPGVTLRDDING